MQIYVVRRTSHTVSTCCAVQMGLCAGWFNRNQGYGPSSGILQRFDNLGTVGWSQCQPSQDQSLFPGDISYSLRVSIFIYNTFLVVTFGDIHFSHKNRGKDWSPGQKNCRGEQVPLTGSTYPAGLPPASDVVYKVLSGIKKPVFLLDITLLSQLRKDAHPSTYSGDHSGNDCSHWCLPGLPDTWNQLMYAAL